MIVVKASDTHDIVFTVNADLTGATIRLLVRSVEDSVGSPTELTAAITDAEAGEITHTLTGDLPVGRYNVEVEITRNSAVTTAPTRGYYRMNVDADLG